MRILFNCRKELEERKKNATFSHEEQFTKNIKLIEEVLFENKIRIKFA